MKHARCRLGRSRILLAVLTALLCRCKDSSDSDPAEGLISASCEVFFAGSFCIGEGKTFVTFQPPLRIIDSIFQYTGSGSGLVFLKGKYDSPTEAICSLTCAEPMCGAWTTVTWKATKS